MVSGQSHHTFRKSGTVNYPTKLARQGHLSLTMDAEKLPNDQRSRSCFRLFSSKEGQFDVDNTSATCSQALFNHVKGATSTECYILIHWPWLALGIGFATTLGLSAAEVSMRNVARRWIGRLLDVIEKLFLVGDKAGSKVVYV